MAIEAELADGRILEFPDGTDPSVIQATVRKVLGVKAPAPAPSAPAPDLNIPFFDPMGGGEFAAFNPVEVQPRKLVAERAIEALPPEPKNQVVGTGVDKMLDPKFVTAVEARLNSLPEEQRREALAKLLQRPDVYGRAAKVVADRYAQQDKVTLPRAREISDLRLEAQVERFMRQGAPRDLAEHLATMQAKSGRLQKGISRLEPNVLGEQAAAAAEARAEELKDAGFFERVGANVTSEMTKSGLGLISVFADITGDTDMQRQASKARTVEEARQGAIPKGADIFERSAQGAITSLATQAPLAVMSMLTGTSVPLLVQAGVQQFGDAYGEARQAGVSPANAATRAIPMAAAEVFFERFGMERSMAGLRAFIQKNGYADVPKYVAEAIAKELPSEMATTVTQYGIDMLPEAGLNKNPSLYGLYQQLEETLRQTVIQAGVQSGAIAAGAKGAEKLSSVLKGLESKGYTRDTSYDGLAELMARSKGFLIPEGGPGTQQQQQQQAPQDMGLGEAGTVSPGADRAEAPPPAAPVTPASQRVEELTQQGIDAGLPEEDARERATNIVTAEEKQREKQEEKQIAPRVEALTQEFIDAGLAPAEAKTRAVAQAKQEAQDDESAARESTNTAPAPGPSGTSVGVAKGPELRPTPGGVAGTKPTGVAPTGRPAEGPAGGEGTQPGAIEKQGATVSFENNRGVVGNESVLGGLRRISEDDDIASESPNRVGAVLLTGLDRQAGGQAGRASEVVKALTEWADKNNETLVLSPAASGDLKQPELVKWYERNGFTQMPDGAMERQPTQPTDGTQTTETQQAEAQGQGQEAPAAGEPAGVAPTPKKRRVAAEGKKLGRPATLTPEQKAANKTKKDAIQAHKARAERAIATAKTVLDALDKVDTIELDALGVDGRAALRNKKRQAIATLLDLQADPFLRGTAVAQRVKEALAHPSITKQEIADLKKGLEAKKTPDQVSRSAVSSAPADARFSKFTNGAQALSHVIKTGNAFQKMLGKRLRAFVNGVKFVVIEQGQAVPSQLQTPRNAKEWDRARALYIEDGITGEKVVYVRGESFGVDQGVNNVTVLHELLHAATNRKIALAMDAIARGVSLNDPLVKSAQALLRTINSAISTFNAMGRAGQLSLEVRAIASERGGAALTDPQEFLAYGMTDPDFQEFLMKARGFEDDTTFFSRFVTGVRKLFGMPDDTANALSDLILVTDTILSSKAPRVGVFKASVSPSAKVEGSDDPAIRTQNELEKEVKIANEKFEQSKNGEEYADNVTAIQLLQNPKKVGRWLAINWSKFNTGAKNALADNLPSDFLADVFGGAVPELRNTNRLIARMKGMTLNLLKATGKLTDEVDRAYRKDKELQAKLDRITNVSTLAEIDPSDPNAKERSAALDRMWNDLGADGQRLYRRIKDHFVVLSDFFGQLLDAQITQSGLSIAERANVLQKVRALYEQGAKITPFFPLVRRGDFWLGIGSGKTRKFFMFESAAERDRAMLGFANERIKQKPGESDSAFATRQKDNLGELLATEEYTHGNDITTLRKYASDSSEMLKAIFNAIDDTKLDDPKAKEEIKDAVYQIYLQTMPEQSFRRQFIHREGVTGFRTDVLRNTADASSRMAIQLARLKYGRLLRNSLSQARDSIVNRTEYEPVVAVFERRVTEELNPTPETKAEKVVSFATMASYIWYLGAASSAILQPLSVFQTGYPVLASRYGTAKASTELAKLMRVWSQYGVYEKNSDGSTTFMMPTVAAAPGLTAEERRAVQAMLEFNLTTSTYASSVFDYKDAPSGKRKYVPLEVGKKAVDLAVLGGLMHSTERISREMVYLASFRLNRRTGKTFDESVNNAVADTKEALGNYDQYNRPEFMRGATGKFLTQFMMYPVHVTLFLIRNFAEMIKPMKGRTRAEAFKKFFGTLGTTFILAGSIGLPMFSVVMGLLGWAWEKLKDDDDPKDLRGIDFQLWFRTIWMQEQLGGVKIAGKSLADILERGVANAITGLDISSRTSLNNLWVRDSKETSTVRESAAAMALDYAGPTANMVLSWAEAYEAFMLGDLAKGLKKAAPAGFRNFITARELATEGAKDNKGAKLLSKDAFTTGELIGQSVGFRPDALSNLQYATFKVIGIEQRINNEREKILAQLDREFRNKNVKKFGEYMRDRNEFNLKHPQYAITDEVLADSLEKKQEQRVESYRGVTLTDKNLDVARALIPSRKAAAEKERKGRGE